MKEHEEVGSCAPNPYASSSKQLICWYAWTYQGTSTPIWQFLMALAFYKQFGSFPHPATQRTVLRNRIRCVQWIAKLKSRLVLTTSAAWMRSTALGAALHVPWLVPGLQEASGSDLRRSTTPHRARNEFGHIINCFLELNWLAAWVGFFAQWKP